MNGHLPAESRGLVFDCDGTLLDTMSAHWASWQAACQKFGMTMSTEQLLAFAGKPEPEVVRTLAKEQGKDDIDCDAFIACKRHHYEASIPDVKPIAPVLAIAEEGKKRGLPMAVASGGARKHVMAGLRANGLESMFSAFVCEEDYTNSKPAPDCFLKAARLIGVPPESCVGYEDSPLGMDAIRDAGFVRAVDVKTMAGYPDLKQ